MLIRKEEAKDYESIYPVVKNAFDNAEYSDGNEQDLVNALREGTAFIPELSLVAEVDGKIVGHIIFTKATVDNSEILVLAPLSVLPRYRRKGIGTALMQEGHKIAKKLGYKYAVVLGSEPYYSRIGYIPADLYGINPPFDVPRENFMAYRINETAPDIYGIVKYAKEFGID